MHKKRKVEWIIEKEKFHFNNKKNTLTIKLLDDLQCYGCDRTFSAIGFRFTEGQNAPWADTNDIFINWFQTDGSDVLHVE